MIEYQDGRVHKQASLICKSACKKALFAAVEAYRPGCKGKLTRVSKTTYDHLEQVVRDAIVKLISSHPSKGHTITMGDKSHAEE